MNLIETAADFARVRHDRVGQLRKYTLAAYWTHTQAVAERLQRMGFPDVVVAAAHLHDTVEDTGTTLDEVARLFGFQVALHVYEVTDQSRPEDGNRTVRKAIDREHVARASSHGQSIKLSDLIDNTGSITTHDPAFARTYMAEKALLLPLLSRGHPDLLDEAWAILGAWERNQIQVRLQGLPHAQ